VAWRMLASKEVLLVVALFVVGLVVGGIGWWMETSGTTPLFTPKTSVSIRVDPVIQAKVIRDGIETLLTTIPAPNKPRSIRLELANYMPDSYDQLLSVGKGTVLGVEGKGMGCGVPEIANNGNEVKVKIYAVLNQYVQDYGITEAEKHLRLLTEKCVTWAAWVNDASPEQYQEKTGMITDQNEELVELL